ncbi:diaminopimelate decarboxylase [Erythrobacteraceae bacterium CFH 75059]|uniref:diaminopimelate decarboxylase n=1 Tax=Qipengyuania thermophila TaxID=2509361 RepID=UPI00101F986D|nr:diaminopimelate decarboxylase [Qipengyuania thermophila]TCD02286.1 diaminopimelate decarboxylase [Erythrobacteraceae bacterium CFH 75059]
MTAFTLRDGAMHAEDVPLATIAQEVGTPVYVYSRRMLEERATAFRTAVAGLGAPLVAFAVKANPNLAVLRVLAAQGLGADVVSGGELRRALAAGVPPASIIFSGVGKTSAELGEAMAAGIGQLNIESVEEAEEVSALAQVAGTRVPCALRVNPDVDAGTHDKITTGRADSKFGVLLRHAPQAYAQLAALPGLHVRGLAVHIGSQLTGLEPLEHAFARVGTLLAALRDAGHTITHVDLGGGLGVPYRPGDTVPSLAAYAAMVARVTQGWNVQLLFEPGRIIAAEAGVLLTRVIRVKRGLAHPFLVVDAGMNDLARPALYGAWHAFEAVQPTGGRMRANIVGPICESGDTFATERDTDALRSGDLAVFRTAGAYGATMASSYNSRGFVPEVLVDGDRYAVVAQRIAPDTIMNAECVPDWLPEAARG